MMECPPARIPPASCTFAAPPCMIFPRMFRSIFSGKQTMFRAVFTSPPIAYTSLKAFAAAISPKRYGSSTIGGKKSSVCTMARCSAT